MTTQKTDEYGLTKLTKADLERILLVNADFWDAVVKEGVFVFDRELAKLLSDDMSAVRRFIAMGKSQS